MQMTRCTTTAIVRMLPMTRNPFVLLAVAGLVLYWAARIVEILYACWRQSRSPLRKLPGPRNASSWISGDTGALSHGQDMEALDAWAREYGDNFVIRGDFGKQVLITSDLRAVTHVIFANYVFPKQPAERRGLEAFFGREGVVWAEGEQHKNQRRVLNPAFGHAQMQNLTPMFLEDSAKMREIWNDMCVAAGGTARVDAVDWIGKATLSITGRAGFDYEVGSLNENAPKSKMAEALEPILRVDLTPGDIARGRLQNHVPFLRKYFPDKRTRQVTHYRTTMHEIGMQILHEKKQAMHAEGNSMDEPFSGGKDLIALLLKANLKPDLHPSLRLNDAEVLAQIPTFLVAAHETTSTTTSWAIYDLAKNPQIQAKLRLEVQQITTETPTLDMLNGVSYLDHVVRETLRLHALLPIVTRTAFKEDLIPLEKPTKGRDGKLLSHIHIHEGDDVIVPVWLINRSKSIWGADADEFRPERWEHLPVAANAIPGITPGLMTFFGGPRACIGHRFAVAEMKALLFHIVRGFEFRLAVDPSEIWARSGPILRPQLRSDNSVQLPILITPVA